MKKEELIVKSYCDIHFHLDLFKNSRSLVHELSDSNVTVVAVTNAPFVYDACDSITQNISNVVTAIGFHPELALKYHDQLGLFSEKLRKTRFIGEVGLDYTKKNDKDRVVQRQVFESIIDYANQRGDAVVTVHSRQAASDVITIIGDSFTGTTILHWFSGKMGEMERAVDLGMYFSINPAMISSDKGRQLISRIPHKRVLTETDGPFIQVEGRPAVPHDVISVVDALSGIWKIDKEEARSIIVSNLSTALAYGNSNQKRTHL